MRRRDWFYLLSGLLLIAIFIGWLYQPSATPVLHTSISVVATTATNSDFQFKNNGATDIFLSRLILETNSPGGWMTACGSNLPADQVVHVGASKDLTFAAPGSNEVWRLRAVYGEQISGVKLMMFKTMFAFSHHQWPGAAFGVFMGSNSVCSPPMTR